MLALKEWAIVCRALEEGKQVVLLRKGGIIEYKEGFEVKQKVFLFYPTFEHQSKEYVQSNYLENFEMLIKDNEYDDSKDQVNTIKILGRVEKVYQFSDKSILPKLEKYHIWNERYVNLRMNYNSTKPMNALLLRVYKMPKPISIDVKPQWSGCKSWIDIELAEKFDKLYYDSYELLNESEPVIDEQEFQKISSSLMELWN